MAYTRISITLPKEVLDAADRRARAVDRSRSWVVVEALRTFLATAPSRVRERAAAPYAARAPGLGPSRTAQLASDLALTPEARVFAAEETARVGELARGPHPRSQRVQSFDRYEDYVDWKRKGDLFR